MYTKSQHKKTHVRYFSPKLEDSDKNTALCTALYHVRGRPFDLCVCGGGGGYAFRVATNYFFGKF